MKIDVSILRKLVKDVLKEELLEMGTERPTVPAHSSKGEQEFAKQLHGKKWGKSGGEVPRSNPKQKDSRVWTAITDGGAMAKMSPEERLTFKNDFNKFMDEKDSSEKLVATAEDLADEFLKSRNS